VTNICITLSLISNSKRPIDFKDLVNDKQLIGNLINFNIVSHWDAKSTGFKACTSIPIYIAVQILILKMPLVCYLP
jgi:hypothetical protein